MVRKFGSKDKKHRKQRSDKGKHRKLYKGKPTKGKRQIKFDRKNGNKQILKLWVWEKVPMSRDGYSHWNRNIRNKISPYVFPTSRRIRIDASTSDINTKAKFEQFITENVWGAGYYYVMGFSNAKNRYHCKPVQLCHIVVKETENGDVGRMVKNVRLHRYKWFYKG